MTFSKIIAKVPLVRMSGRRRIFAQAEVSLLDIISTTFCSCSSEGENPTFGILCPLSASSVMLTLKNAFKTKKHAFKLMKVLSKSQNGTGIMD